jgi:hypothetical protein
VALTITTLDEETSAITGGDWEAKFPQRVKESKMVRDAGLDVEVNKNKAAIQVADQPGNKENAADGQPKKPDPDKTDDDTEDV